MVVMVLFTMTACKRKKPVVDSVETSAQVTVENTTVNEDRQEMSTLERETSEGVDESQSKESTEAEGDSSATSSTGNKKPTGSTNNQGQTGLVGDGETAGSSGWESEERPKYPWELGGKQPSEYTWEEYLALSSELKDAFLKNFSDARAYENWRDNALKIYNEGGDTTPPDEEWEEPTQESPKLDIPWEKSGAKQPSEYTWGEFQVLSPELQMAFQNWFTSVEEFNNWMKRAQGGNGSIEPEIPTYPWDMPDTKKPDQYTWEEYEALTSDQQMAFQNWFASIDEFESWMQNVQEPQESQEPEDDYDLPWDVPGAKQPDQYTWAEFEALNPDHQMAFQNWFASIDGFEVWMKQAQGDSSTEEEMPWDESGAKQPAEYTWTEFEALSPAQQMAFQNWFASIDEFEAWMQKAQGNDFTEEKMPWDESGAKQPSEYTWDEFEALLPGQQMAFQNWFGGWEEFDKWLSANQP